MKSLKKYIPNAITSLNLFSGTLATIFIFEGHLQIGAVVLLAAAFFDFCDGLAARTLKAYSPMGKELDSLADMVSFGVAPGMILLVLLKNAWGFTTSTPVEVLMTEPVKLLPALIIPVFSGLRLAKFNVDERQTTSFIGLPTPANALLLTSLGWASMSEESGLFFNLSQNPFFLVSLGLLGSYLLVSEIPMFSLKFKSLKWRENQIRFLFLACSIILLVMGGFSALSLVILLYVLISYVAGRLFKITF